MTLNRQFEPVRLIPTKGQMLFFAIVIFLLIIIGYNNNGSFINPAIVSLLIVILIQGIILRIPQIPHYTILYRILFFTLYIVPYLIYPINIDLSLTFSYKFFLSPLFCLVLLLMEIKNVTLMISKSFVSFLPKIDTEKLIGETLGVIGSVIFEEFFFRGFLFTIFLGYTHWIIALILCTLSFCLHHYITPWAPNTLNLKGVFLLFCFATVQHLAFYFSKSIYSCIIGHLLFNTPTLLQNFLKYKYGSNMVLEWQKGELK